MVGSLQQISDNDLFTLDDIDSAFQNVTRLTYSQNHHLSGMYKFNILLKEILFQHLILLQQKKGRGLLLRPMLLAIFLEAQSGR